MRAPESSADWHALREQGFDLHERGEWRRAAAIYRDLLRHRADDTQVLHAFAVLATQEGRCADALALFDSLFRLTASATIHADRANALLGLRRYPEALAAYDGALALDPQFAAAHINRGHALRELRRPLDAAAAYDAALRAQPDFFEALMSRGSLMRALSRPEDALHSYSQAVKIRPYAAAAHFNLGNAQSQLRQWPAALASYAAAIRLRPDFAEAHYNGANVLKSLRQFDAALAAYDRALVIKPEYTPALDNRGLVLRELDRLQEALSSHEAAIATDPHYAPAFCNRALALAALLRLEEALASYDVAIGLQPDSALAYCGRGLVLRQLDRVDEALASYDTALALQPAYAQAHSNRGNLFYERQEVDAAIDAYDRAIAADPDLQEPRFNRSMAMLLAGDLVTGFREYEWRGMRSRTEAAAERRVFAQPTWNGVADLRGKTLLLYAEQGFGDTVQFCRYAPLAAARGARVIVEAPAGLTRLLSTLSGLPLVIPQGQPLPAFDYQCSLMSLPMAFGTTLESIPNETPYLRPEPATHGRWVDPLGAAAKLRVGLVWSGGFRPNQPELWAVNHRRNIPLSQFATLGQPGVEFYSLQKGEAAERELAQAQASSWGGPSIRDFTADLQDFADTAALIATLDLVISVDTATAHLAGAMGKPVWLLNRFDGCWRWLIGRRDSPWYPTLRLYRQSTRGDWTSVIEEVRNDLAQLVASKA